MAADAPGAFAVSRAQAPSVKVFGLAGWSGSGKTTLLKRLLAELTARGLRVSTVKHAHHSFDLAEPKARDDRLRAAGVAEMIFASPERWALLHEIGDAPEPEFEALLPRLSPVDLVLIEGFKRHRHDKIEVHRAANGKPLLAPSDPHIVAIATDTAIAAVERGGKRLPTLDLNDARAVADFIIAHCGLRPAAAERSGA